MARGIYKGKSCVGKRKTGIPHDSSSQMLRRFLLQGSIAGRTEPVPAHEFRIGERVFAMARRAVWPAGRTKVLFSALGDLSGSLVFQIERDDSCRNRTSVRSRRVVNGCQTFPGKSSAVLSFPEWRREPQSEHPGARQFPKLVVSAGHSSTDEMGKTSTPCKFPRRETSASTKPRLRPGHQRHFLEQQREYGERGTFAPF